MSTQIENRLPIPAEITTRLVDVMRNALLEAEIAEDFQVTDAESAKLAGEQLSAVSNLMRKLNEERMGYTRPYDALKADIKAEYDKPVEKLAAASDALRTRLQAYLQEQERIRQAALRAENERIEREHAEARRRLEAEQARAESLKTEPAKAKAAVRIEEAMVAVAEASVSTAIAPPKTKIKGFGMREELVADYEAFDKVALLRAALENPRLMKYIQLQEAEINKVVKSLQDGALDIIPGLALKKRVVTVSR